MLIDYFQDLSKYNNTDKSIICYLLNHINDLDSLTINTLAKDTYTSNATIIRFCRKLGCDGFKSFKIRLIKELNSDYNTLFSIDANKPFMPTDSVNSISRNLAELLKGSIDGTLQSLNEKDINAIIDNIETCNRVFIFAKGDSFITAAAFKNRLIKVNKYVILADDFHEGPYNITNVMPNDFALFITYSGQHYEYKSYISILKAKKIPTAIITAHSETKLARMCDTVIQVPQSEGVDDKISSFTAQLSFEYVLDTLYAILFNRNYILNYDQKLKNDHFVSKILIGETTTNN